MSSSLGTTVGLALVFPLFFTSQARKAACRTSSVPVPPRDGAARGYFLTYPRCFSPAYLPPLCSLVSPRVTVVRALLFCFLNLLKPVLHFLLHVSSGAGDKGSVFISLGGVVGIFLVVLLLKYHQIVKSRGPPPLLSCFREWRNVRFNIYPLSFFPSLIKQESTSLRRTLRTVFAVSGRRCVF